MKQENSAPNDLKKNISNAIQTIVTEFQKDNKYVNSDFSRNRVLTMEKIIHLLLSMQGGSLQKELFDAKVNVTASAFVQQRAKIPWMVFEDIFECFNSLCEDAKTFRGYRVLAIDGTTLDMPGNPKTKGKSQDNQLHVNTLYDVLNKTFMYCVVQQESKRDEAGALAFMLTWYDFKEKTLIVADRGYASYRTLADLQSTPNVDFLIRVKNNHFKKCEIDNHLTPFRRVEIPLETGEYETLITSLPTSITPEELKELYHARWGIETAFRELKYNLGLVNLHGKKADFVIQEIYAAMIMSNFCSRIVNEVVVQKNQANIHEYQVNMKMAIYICRQFYRNPNGDSTELLEDLAKYTEPIRPGRHYERKRKEKSSSGFVYRVHK